MYCNNVDDFLAQVIIERNLSPDNVEVQIGMDDGQGLLKVMLTVKEKSELGKIIDKPARSCYSEGFSCNTFQHSSVKKTFVIAIVKATENYHAVCTLLYLLKLDNIEFGFSLDLKMVLIVCGKQAASSKFCCPYCSGCSPWTDEAEPATIGSLWS